MSDYKVTELNGGYGYVVSKNRLMISPDELEAILNAERRPVVDTIEEITKSGWRCCIDHIIKPESPCPICALTESVNLLQAIKPYVINGATLKPELRVRLDAAIAQYQQGGNSGE